jgi:hypothetical protein
MSSGGVRLDHRIWNRKSQINNRISKLMISEHDMVVLTSALPQPKLQPGDVGTVVHVYRKGEAYEVECSTMRGGPPFALVTATAEQVRPLGTRGLAWMRVTRKYCVSVFEGRSVDFAPSWATFSFL